ncbi:MAG: glycosyltransferase family 1 protein, partial [Endozoicomonas sp.]
NPLKLREYMASGTPIASTAFPAVEAYCELIAIQNTKEPFSQVILKALRQKEKASLRQNHVSLASWSHQSTQLDQLIGHLLSQ